MARTSLNYNTQTKTARLKLIPRPKPYYRQMAPGKRLGYMRRDGAGSWIVAEWINGREKTQVIGQADDFVQADGLDILTFEQAQKKAIGDNATAPIGKITVAEAIDVYLLQLAKRSDYAKDVRGQADKHIVEQLGGLRVDRLTTTQVEAWLGGLVKEGDDQEVVRKSKDTANRIFATLRAALNAAFADESNKIPSDAAWRRVKPFKAVSRPRGDDFEAAEVQRFVAAAATFDQSLANMIEAGFLTGARMGELAALDVRHLDGARRSFHIAGVSKGAKKTGERFVTLTEEAVAFLQGLARGKKPTDILLPTANGERWPRGEHCRAIKQALEIAQLPSTASFYTLRHSYISRAIEAGMPLSLIAENCGTSLLMIQRNYAKVLMRTRREMIQKTGPALRVVG